ncbi:hypothetical protein PAAG_12042 [Paracoccidioides lutzii Pb01]|uniref:Uncharacterized protein n=1 Tax=Paracoccidioides lutzii (strain ATCC MYA-826 / Pb01) TaxID=502779 RepID=A0A0A2V0F4_PARBA|nr:hypothetical protein PAAG_12042 [Paracoccidioides lutzii Pb01]KGQ01271.1 hypothetical protein PAAG_12042 [Paracoccidioides lutzii Pb01]
MEIKEHLKGVVNEWQDFASTFRKMHHEMVTRKYKGRSLCQTWRPCLRQIKGRIKAEISQLPEHWRQVPDIHRPAIADCIERVEVAWKTKPKWPTELKTL